MSNLTDLLTAFFFVCFTSISLGAAYQMIIEPGEFLSAVPRYFRGRGKFLEKLTSCGKCVGGWIAFTIFPIAFPYSMAWFAFFLHAVAIAFTIVVTGLISAYVSART